MPTKTLVIVESPAKAKTIEKYLGKGYTVMASVGHVRDLPKSNKDAVDIENGFKPKYVITPGKSHVVADIKVAAAKADEVLLATDPDREGEAIAWHIAEIAKLKNAKRVVFHEITKDAVNEAIQHPRAIDQNLRKAQEARRVLDRLVGYDLSGLIWKKVRYGLSAGRVQSPALRILMEREREIRAFVPERFYTLEAKLKTKTKDEFSAFCTIEPKEPGEAKRIVDAGEKGTWKVVNVEEAPVKRAPRPPFTTSTLQQSASSRLGFSPSRTMRAAQKLYEAGHITYMRTDSFNLAQVAVAAIAGYVEKTFGNQYLETKVYKTRSKNAQEAHEAIRPTEVSKTHAGNGDDEQRLYRLIHARTVASQMKDAGLLRTKIIANIENSEGRTSGIPDFAANGSIVIFDGWLKADPHAKGEDVILPKVSADDPLTLMNLASEEKFTTPPNRYTEAGLVKELEKRGIGRPSTYASIMRTIEDRGYVVKEGRTLMPTPVGDVVSTFLEKNFEKYVSDSFTAEMEDELDQIADGTREYEPTLHDFYGPFTADVASKADVPKLTSLGAAPKEFPCPICGGAMEMKLSRNGVFMSCIKFPECTGARTEKGDIMGGEEPMGTHPELGLPIYVRNGRFGPYLEMPLSSEASAKEESDPASRKATQGAASKRRKTKAKAKRASIPPAIIPADITMEQAVKLLSLPRELGQHHESGKMVSANIGRFGPYIVHEADFRSLKTDDPYTITHERALEILKEPKKVRRGGFRKKTA
jgi:DNA topoisomerase-1